MPRQGHVGRCRSVEMRHEVMNKSADTAVAAHLPAQGAARQPAYSEEARPYDRRPGAFQGYRRAVVEALPVCQGQVVLDGGCGTALCCGFPLRKAWPRVSVDGC